MGAGLIDRSRRPRRCPRCRYDLAGLERSRCPECGSDVRLEAVNRARRLVRRLQIVAAWELAAIAALAAAAGPLLGLWTVPLSVAVLCGVGAWVLRRGAVARRAGAAVMVSAAVLLGLGALSVFTGFAMLLASAASRSPLWLTGGVVTTAVGIAHWSAGALIQAYAEARRGEPNA